ncbi:MAG: hypothetical protein DRR19_18465 [Candidatus Parabeggiatoa sp. nov. 1]|nr:MAG: hypothetical protein DRR19_18465 [Gammaproteobacteria bacterium]
MQQRIFGAWSETDVIPTLLEGLQHLEVEYGNFEKVGIATLMEGRIQCQNTHSLQNLQNVLQEQSLSGHFGVAYTCPKSAEDMGKNYAAHMCANERIAIVFHGMIENFAETQHECLALGYPCETQNDGEIVLGILNRYLKISGISPLDALTLTLTCLKGYFAIIALFAEENLLMVARRGCQIAIGVDENVTLFGSDTKALTLLSRRVMQLEEGSPTVLCSVAGEIVKGRTVN